MTGGTTIVVIAGVAIFAVVAYLIVRQESNNSAFGDLTGLLAGAL